MMPQSKLKYIRPNISKTITKIQFIMRTVVITILSVFSFLAVSQAQYETVILNYEKSYFGENQPLPAEKYFMINGTIRPDVQYVEMNLFSAKGKDKRKPLFENFWKRDFNNSAPTFNLPVNYKLKEGKSYDILINFYRSITERERAKLTRDIYGTLDAYVDQSFSYSDKKVKLLRNNQQTINDLNEIVDRGMSLYRSRTLATFPGYSDMVKLKLEQIESIKLKKAEDMEFSSDTLGARMTMRTQLLKELKFILRKEVSQYLNAEIYVLLDDKFINDYPTETINDAYYLAPHFGYGGVAFNTNPDEFTYDSGMYAGLSFPLAKNSKNNFLSNTAISVGAFIGNFEDPDGNKVSGPLFKVPTYVALGYKPFGFFRVQAGVAFLEDASTAGTVSGFENRVEVRPFVGISAELNVWFNLNK